MNDIASFKYPSTIFSLSFLIAYFRSQAGLLMIVAHVVFALELAGNHYQWFAAELIEELPSITLLGSALAVAWAVQLVKLARTQYLLKRNLYREI